MTSKVNWIADKILKQEDALQETIAAIHDGKAVPPDQPTVPALPDANAEQQAFADLLAALKDTDEGDADTAVTVLSAEEFSAESFTPDTPKEPSHE